jgi:hypothetical protein
MLVVATYLQEKGRKRTAKSRLRLRIVTTSEFHALFDKLRHMPVLFGGEAFQWHVKVATSPTIITYLWPEVTKLFPS